MIFVIDFILNLLTMKAKIIPILYILVFISLIISSCEDTTLREYKGYAPVYMSYKDLRSSVGTASDIDIQNPGKICFKDNYIFIVEEMKGIHVFDNTDPSAPVKKAFVKLPGVVDISVSGSDLYADSYVDLVVLDVSDIQNIHEAGRVKDIMPYTVPATAGTEYPMAYIDKEKGVVTGWELRTIKEKIDINPNPGPYPVYYDQSSFKYYDLNNAAGASSGVSGSGIGIGGSMARFGIKDNVLFIVESNVLKILDISDRTSPARITDSNVTWNTETMFLSGNRMFLGTTTGMAVYDISSPFSPYPLTFFSHARSCDPVIVDDTLAYVTLRTGSSCGGNQNLLEIINIKDITKPVSVVSYFMTDPHGLGKDGDLLFVCDGSAGLKVYNAADPKNLLGNLIYTYPNIQAYDAIPIGRVLVLISKDGLFQYDYSNVKNITLLSKIPVIKSTK
jgi:hypothetical protein